jgi:hypothetical protein
VHAFPAATATPVRSRRVAGPGGGRLGQGREAHCEREAAPPGAPRGHQECYAALEKQEHRLFPRELYKWSKRWRDAELALATKKDERIRAHEAHVKRMKKWEALVKKMFQAGHTTSAETSAVKYYRSDAELALEKAKK